MAADSFAFCCALPVVALAVLVAWARVRAFGQAVGGSVLFGVAVGTLVATVCVARDVARTDRLVGWARADSCGRTPSPGWLVRPPLSQTTGDLTAEGARAAGLPLGGETTWAVTYRRAGLGSIAADGSHVNTLMTYPTEAAHGASLFFADAGEIGDDEVVFVALRSSPIETLLPDDPSFRPDSVVAHETIALAWFWIVDDTLVIHGRQNGGVLELRDLDLHLRARATGTGSIDAPQETLVADADGGMFAALVVGERPAIGHLTADGAWTRTELDAAPHDVARLTADRGDGLCAWSDEPRGGALHVTGDPLAVRPWPISVVLRDRQVALIALVAAWLVTIIVARRVVRLAHPLWALRRGDVRVGSVRDARTERATWIEPGRADAVVRGDAWLGFVGESAEPEPAVAIGAALDAGNPAYRDSAREAMRARWIARGTVAEAEAHLRQRLGEAASWLGFVALLLGVPAVVTAIAASTS